MRARLKIENLDAFKQKALAPTGVVFKKLQSFSNKGLRCRRVYFLCEILEALNSFLVRAADRRLGSWINWGSADGRGR